LYKKELSWIRRAPSGRQTKSDFRAKRFYDIQDNYDMRKDMFFEEQAKLSLSIQERQL